MQLTIKLFATFREGRFKVEDREFPEGSRAGDVLNSLEITQEEVAICLVNGRDADMHRILSKGDTLSLFPPVGGG